MTFEYIFLTLIVLCQRVNSENGNRSPRFLNKHYFFVELVGNPAQIDCSVTGAKPITVIWRKDNTVLESNVEGIAYIKDGQILKIKRLRVEDHGRYQCVVKNRYGSVNQTVQLYAQEVPKEPFLPTFDSKNLKIIEAAVGDNVTVAEPVEVPFDSHYKLFFNQREVDVPLTAPIIKEAKRTDVQYRNFTVKFYNISEKDYGNYTLLVENEKERAAKSFILRKPTKKSPNGTTVHSKGSHKSLTSTWIIMSVVGGFSILVLLSIFIFVQSKRHVRWSTPGPCFIPKVIIHHNEKHIAVTNTNASCELIQPLKMGQLQQQALEPVDML